ncbi:NAD(P)-dependent oxidoreductase [Senegalia massiliensis]|uniref:Hydroxyacid dehydrogenase n=1 Tax=Senegalia massiliensis TaxID=1720316 RepID=A0A845QY45_9CLOT|nr:NAD(P)-dependent oxidoreductase [Senegalia massiliensis]NBI07395.1 hydroxyacid dehydrogenase [Senegalia massiliensis]
MKVKLIEPLNVSHELIKELSEPIKALGHEFVYYNEKTTDNDELIERSKDADIIMIGNNPYPKEVIKEMDSLKLINVAFTGVDHVAVDDAKKKDIKICNAAGYSDQAVSELAIGLTLDIYRKISDSSPLIGKEIKDKTVGIIGTGNIGIRTAELFSAFGAKLIAYSRTEKDEAKELGIKYVSLDELLSSSDIISVHLPLNDNTRGFLNKEKLEKINDNAILINCARGPIIDNEALANLLNQDKIAGAGIDVFDMEPPLPKDYPLLYAKNIVLTPHIAYFTEESMIRRAKIAFDNTISFLKGDPKNIMK